jgi:hypothetical protein
MYADAEAVVVAYLTASVPGLAGVSVELPNDVNSNVPFVQVTRVGGSDDYVTDSAIIDLDVFGLTRVQASDASRLVHNAMMRLRHTAVNGVLIDLVETQTGPMWVNWGDENLERYVMSYRIDSRVNSQSS